MTTDTLLLQELIVATHGVIWALGVLIGGAASMVVLLAILQGVRK